MKRIIFAACLFLGLIGHGADAKDSSDDSIDSYQVCLKTDDFSLCKAECKADSDKIEACLKSDGGKLGELRVKLYEKCKCDDKCHQKVVEEFRKKQESRSKEEKKSKEEKSKEEKKSKEAFTKIMTCLKKAGVASACLPKKAPVCQGNPEGDL